MSNKFSIPRGTADILPNDMSLWYELEQKARNMLRLYGYNEIRTPIFEETALFKRSLGQTSDVVNKQLLELSSQKESTFALRPEGTAAVVRSYIENNLARHESISKFYYVGPMFRGERPQKGRLRQFHQIGAEVIGPGTLSPYLDAEMIALSVDFLSKISLTEFSLKINTLGTLEDKESFSKFLREQLSENISDLCDKCKDRFERNVFRILDCKSEHCRAIVNKLDLSTDHLSQESQDYFNKVCLLLDQLNVKYTVSPDLVRGLDYYTHTVFELSYAGLGSQDAVGAGGRYNTLVGQLGGDKNGNIGAMGFALGVERLLLAINRESKTNIMDCFIVAMDEESREKAFHLMQKLRNLNVSVDMHYQGSIKSQMKTANKLNARFTLILGLDEVKNKTFTLKNMLEGDQHCYLDEEINDVARNIILNNAV